MAHPGEEAEDIRRSIGLCEEQPTLTLCDLRNKLRHGGCANLKGKDDATRRRIFFGRRRQTYPSEQQVNSCLSDVFRPLNVPQIKHLADSLTD